MIDQNLLGVFDRDKNFIRVFREYLSIADGRICDETFGQGGGARQ